MSRPTLVDLLAKYSDRVYTNSIGTDKNTIHCFGPFYELLLRPLRRTATSVLEIGIRGGGSLCVWAEYFENARITGLDIADMGSDVLARSHPGNIGMYFLDATLDSTPDLIEPNTFDFIIDDGSHIAEHQIAALRIWGPRLRPGGIFIIEDIYPFNVQRIKSECAPLVAAYGLEFDVYDWNHMNPGVNSYKNDIVAVFSKPRV